MRISGEETTVMSRSFLTKKYSHCPLKKRPVQFIKEENFESGKFTLYTCTNRAGFLLLDKNSHLLYLSKRSCHTYRASLNETEYS